MTSAQSSSEDLPLQTDGEDGEVLFVPDKLCQRCLRIFEQDWKYLTRRAFHLDLESASNCRLCALLVSGFIKEGDSRKQLLFCSFSKDYTQIMFDKEGVLKHLSIEVPSKNPGERDSKTMCHYSHRLAICTDSAQSIALVRRWLSQCIEHHLDCRDVSPRAPFVPSRLVEIHGVTETDLEARLYETRQNFAGTRYTTLSHCWGSLVPFKLLSSNKNALLTRISLSDLSKVFKDAIVLTWRLGFRYIWIDSLCIIQDSSNDWVAESSRMDSIYRGGILNIAATGFADGSNGLFVRREPALITPIRVAVKTDSSRNRQLSEPDRPSGPQESLCYVLHVQQWREGVIHAPLSQRAWALQERALSVRTIHFGRQQLFWECMCQTVTEVYPNTFPEELDPSPKDMLKPGASAKHDGRHMSPEMSKWVDIVRMYSRCSLTCSKDKLVAVSGIAKFLGKSMNCEYLAGLWRQDLEHQLLWYVRSPPPTEKQTMRAPSWSWASVDASITMDKWNSIEGSAGQDCITLLHVNHASIDLATEDEFGQVRSGLITLRGRLSIAIIHQSNIWHLKESRVHATRGTLADNKIETWAYFDTLNAETNFVGKLAYKRAVVKRFSFFRGDSLSIEDPDSKLIFLLPITPQEKGQFTRVGQFNFSRPDYDPHTSDFEYMSASTDIFNDKFFISKEGTGDSTEYTISIV